MENRDNNTENVEMSDDVDHLYDRVLLLLFPLQS